ncbi:hypothetical protein M5D96_011721, partial [Drosophila gunungcola]
HRRNKRRRVSENQEIEDRLESLILRVGERSTSSVESNLEGLVSVLEADLGTFRLKILRILSDCAVRMPEKCTVYTTLNYKFGGEFVDHMVKTFKESLKLCRWDAARYSLRFLADLVNCHVISATSLLQLLDTMIDVSNEDTVPQVRRDWFVFAVLSTLPWESALESLLLRIEVYLNKRSKKHHNALRVWSSDAPHPQEEYLDCLWAQIRKLRQDNWAEKHIPRPYLVFDSILCEALQHNLPAIYPMPWVVYRMFDYTDCPDGPNLPGAHSIERFLIEEHLHHIIETYHHERKDCAAQLLSFPFKHKIPLEYCIVEVLAQATEILFMRIDSMNTSCFDRFVNWFSYHLSNFKFTWSWDEWDSCLLLDGEHPRPKFIQEVLQKCLRLSYHQRITEMMPTTYAKLIPMTPVPNYKYANEEAASLPGTTVAHQLVVAIRQKCAPEEVVNILKDIPSSGYSGEEMSDGSFNALKIDVFVQTLLNLGSKSFSHSFAAISKFHSEAQICILHNIFELWSSHQQMMVVLIDKLLKLQIVDCSAVATWIFSKEMTGEFTKMYLWEILHLTIKKMNKHVIKLNSELSEAKDKLAKADSSSSDSEDDSSHKRKKPITHADKPSEEVVERMEEKLEAANVNQKRLFLIVFQRFIMILSEHLLRSDTDGRDPDTDWYRWTIGRLQQVFLMHHEQVQKYSSTLETLLFTSDLDTHILEVFQQFVALRA